MRKSTLLLSLLAAALLLTGCITPSASRWAPEDRTVLLYNPTVMTVEDGFTFADYIHVAVRGEISGFSRTAHDTFETHIFQQDDTTLFVQRIVKIGRFSHFTPLMGNKTIKWDLEWRDHTYGLHTEDASYEFKKYLPYVPKTENVKVHILDRLGSEHILFRIMTIQPTTEADLPKLPSYSKLYRQLESFDSDLRLTPNL